MKASWIIRKIMFMLRLPKISLFNKYLFSAHDMPGTKAYSRPWKVHDLKVEEVYIKKKSMNKPM